MSLGWSPMRSTIRVLNGFGKSLEGMLPKLRNGYLAPDAETARPGGDLSAGVFSGADGRVLSQCDGERRQTGG